MSIKVILSFLLVASLSFGANTASPPKVAPKELPTLIFFINPNGAPCQMQDRILQSGKAELDKRVKLRYVKTTEPNDRELFYQFGIRSLPNLILVDAKGVELNRFAPGIQDLETIMSVLEKK